jgi:hypothetical protein
MEERMKSKTIGIVAFGAALLAFPLSASAQTNAKPDCPASGTTASGTTADCTPGGESTDSSGTTSGQPSGATGSSGTGTGSGSNGGGTGSGSSVRK